MTRKSVRLHPVQFHIFQQGAPLVKSPAAVSHRSSKIVCLSIDLDSKWCGVAFTGDGPEGPEIGIEATERTYKSCGSLSPDKTGPTIVQFPKHIGWSVFATSCARYTIRVVLTKDTEVPHPLVS